MAITHRVRALFGAPVVCLAITAAATAAAAAPPTGRAQAGSPTSTNQREAVTTSNHHATSQTSAPAWAASLGRGVTITKPGTQPAPGTTSPGGVVEENLRR